jgi:hypothetical protein
MIPFDALNYMVFAEHRFDFRKSQLLSFTMTTRTLPRRQFFKQLAATAVVAPTILNAQDKSGSKPLIVGSGEHTYECINDWGRASLPANHEYGWTSNGMAIDEAGRLYVSHHGTPGSIFVFDEHGKFIRSMAEQHRTPRRPPVTGSIFERTATRSSSIYRPTVAAWLSPR